MRSAQGLLLIIVLAGGSLGAQDWPYHQGDLRRSGCPDGRALPPQVKVLWTLAGTSHYLAAPAYSAGRIILPALGAFNSPEVVAIGVEDGLANRTLWGNGPPTLGLPVAASPTVRDGLVVVGEGMHQNVAGALSAFSLSDGLPVWRLQIAGALRHVEGAAARGPDGKIYFGAGSGGVLCVDPGKVTMGGRVLSAAGAETAARKALQELKAEYEKIKDTDDFAIEPGPADVLKATGGTPKVLWTAGADSLHVDASVALAEVRPGRGAGELCVIAGSAFLDEESAGERALVCLKASDGEVVWKVPLRWNPWGAPSVAPAEGKGRVLVGCSSIRFDPATLEGARGEVVAVDLDTGRLAWRREVPGGVLSSVAIDSTGSIGVFTATDGVVRGVDIASGRLVWSSAAGGPTFAGVAIAGLTVYTVDLDGRIRALDLRAGSRMLWSLDIGKHPSVKLPGRVFASPICAGGRLYVATHNMEGPQTGEPTAVVCLGASVKEVDANRGIFIDRKNSRVVVDVEIAPRKLPHLKQVYPVEVMVAGAEGKKAHETVLVSVASPFQVHRALEKLGLKAGQPGIGDKRPATGPEVRIWIEYPGRSGLNKKVDLASAVVDRRTGLALDGGASSAGRAVRWFFTGSAMVQADSSSAKEIYGAEFSGTLVTIFPVTDETVFQSNLGMDAESLFNLEVAGILPPVGSKAKLLIEPVVLAGEGGR